MVSSHIEQLPDWREFSRGQLSPRAAALKVAPRRARRAPLGLAWPAAAARPPATSESGADAAAVRGGASLLLVGLVKAWLLASCIGMVRTEL